MRLRHTFLIFWAIKLLLVNNSFSQELGINEFLIYHNANEKVHNYFYLSDEYRIVYSSQIGSQGLTIRLMDKSNLIKDTLKNKHYFQEFVPLGNNEFMLTSLYKSFKMKITDGKFDYSDMNLIDEIKNKSWESLVIKGNVYSWVKGERKGKFINQKLLMNDKVVLIDEIPMVYKSPKKNPTGKQRFLDLRQNVVEEQLVMFLFKSQRIYFVDVNNQKVRFYDLPKYDNAVWYYFADHISQKHFLVKEFKDGNLELYGFYKDSGIQKLYDLPYFPSAVVKESIFIKKDQDDGTYHYLIPFQKLKPLESASTIIPLKAVLIKAED